jgi:thiol-disulfide isomerase/thioredoxin
VISNLLVRSIGFLARITVVVIITQCTIARSSCANSGVNSSLSAADIAWNELESINLHSSASNVVYKEAAMRFGEDRVKLRAWTNQVKAKYRDLGLQFSKNFPNDHRKFVWLLATVASAPDQDNSGRANDQYSAGVAKPASRWTVEYLVLRAEFMAAKEISDDDKGALLGYEFRQKIIHAESVCHEDESELTLLAMHLHDLLTQREHPVPDYLEPQLCAWFLQLLDGFPAIEAAFLTSLASIPDPAIADFAVGRLAVANLRTYPLELRLSALDGGIIDLKELRGKVVLLDMWSNSCAACIEAMPRIQNVYENYRARGFEVIGLWLSAERPYAESTIESDGAVALRARERPTALAHLKRHGVTWRNGVLTGSEKRKFEKQYGIDGVPVTWLLDSEGRLITTNVTGDRLEIALKRILK